MTFSNKLVSTLSFIEFLISVSKAYEGNLKMAAYWLCITLATVISITFN